MRIDKFLNTVNIVKRRSVAEDMCKSKVVSINGIVAKPAKDVKVGDKIEIKYLEKTDTFEVLDIPTTKTVSKKDKELYVREVGR
jgi:ribosomal 50S subunit-recycling heat shock protein